MPRPTLVLGHCSLVIATFLLLSLPAFAQTPPAPGGPRGFDPVAIHDRIFDGIKTAIAPTDEEWKRLEPKLTKILLLRIDVTIVPNPGGRMGSFLGPGGLRSMIRTFIDPNSIPSQVEEKSKELQQLIDNNETSKDAYKNALVGLRKARDEAQQKLEAAQKDLTTLITPRQEATLVQLGLLD